MDIKEFANVVEKYVETNVEVEDDFVYNLEEQKLLINSNTWFLPMLIRGIAFPQEIKEALGELIEPHPTEENCWRFKVYIPGLEIEDE